MTVLWANNASALLAAPVGLGDTSITLQTGNGALFPAPGVDEYFYLTLSNTIALEIVKCTSRTGDVLTVTRAQDGTSAITCAAGDKAELRVTRAGLQELKPPTATTLEMQQGTETELRSMSPKLVLDAIAANSAGTGGQQTTGDTVLTAASPAMNSVTTTAYGQDVTLPDATTLNEGVPIFGVNNSGNYPLLIKDFSGTLLRFVEPQSHCICSLSDSSSSAGEWNILGGVDLNFDVYGNVTFASSVGSIPSNVRLRRVSLDADRTMLLVSGDTSVHAIVYDHVNKVYGSPVLVRTANILDNIQAILQSTNQVLVVTCANTTALQAVILSVSGTTITVNSAASATLSAAMSSFGGEENGAITQFGSSFLISYLVTTSVAQLRALTVSGTTVTIGAATATIGPDVVPIVFATSSSVALVFSQTASSTITASCYTISGTTITLGSSASITSDTTGFNVRQVGSRYAVVSRLNTTTMYGSIVSVSGTAPSVSSVNIGLGTGVDSTQARCAVVGSQVIVAFTGSSITYFNVLTDNAGVAVAGTPLTATQSNGGVEFAGVGSNTLKVSYIGAVTNFLEIGISGNNPVILSTVPSFSSGTVALPGQSQTYKSSGAGLGLIFNNNKSTKATIVGSPTQSSRLSVNGKSITYEKVIPCGVDTAVSVESTDSIFVAIPSKSGTQTQTIIARVRLAK